MSRSKSNDRHALPSIPRKIFVFDCLQAILASSLYPGNTQPTTTIRTLFLGLFPPHTKERASAVQTTLLHGRAGFAGLKGRALGYTPGGVWIIC